MRKVNVITTKQKWKELKDRVENTNFLAAFKQLQNRVKDTCLFDVSSLNYGIAYCYNSGSEDDSDLKKQNRKITAYAFINATSELSAGDITGDSGGSKNEPLRSGKKSSKNAASKTTVKIAVGR